MATRDEKRLPHTRALSLAGQRGFGGFFMMILLATFAASAAMFTFYRADEVGAEKERQTAQTLADAKTALVGYAVGRAPRPGELPCPDINGDGLQDTPCLVGIRLGRLPWKTLGMPEPRDGAGEALWYAVASTFRPQAANLINSDTRGNLVVRAADNVTVQTSDAVAVILSPGAPIGNQSRSAVGTVLCTITGAALGRHLCASNYLESLGGTNNANPNGPFVAGAPSETFNDRLIYLTTSELMPAVEMRVGGEVKKLLEGYRANSPCKCYPWADNWPYSGGIADTGQNRGRFPSVPAPYAWGEAGVPTLPAWLVANNWHNLIWYSVSRQNSQGEGALCRTCSEGVLLSVGGTQVSALFFMPGTPLDGLPRLASTSRRNNLGLYLEDAANNDGANRTLCPDTGEIGETSGSGSALTGATTCDTYAAPSATVPDRDRLFTVGVAAPGTCQANAAILLSRASTTTCGGPGNSVLPECQAAVDAMDSCTCLGAARALTRPPCYNVLNPKQCQAAITQLQACTL